MLDIWLFPFTATGLIDGLVMLVIAVSFTALGVTPIVSARLVPVAPDGMVQTLSQVFHCEFGKAKYFFDGSCVGISLVYGLVRTGAAVGIGIGTVAAALLAGGICTFWVVCSTAGSWPLWKSLRACRRIEREGSGHEAAVWN